MLAWAPGTGAISTGAHPFNFEINGTDYIHRVDRKRIRIVMPGPGENGSMTIYVEDPDSSIEIVEWDHVRFIEWAATRPITFGGFVQSVRTTVWAMGGRTHFVRCVGYGILLDKRQIVSFASVSSITYWGIGPWLQILITHFGGIITAPGYSFGLMGSAHTTQATVSGTILIHGDWSDAAGGQDALADTTLRGAIEKWGNTGVDLRPATTTPAPFIYWVDAYAYFHATWIPSDAPDDSYEGFGTAITDSSNSPQDTAWLEGDGSDYLTSVYVKGSSGFSGFVRHAPHPVAGDIEGTLSVSGPLLDPTIRDYFGEQELQTRESALVVAEISRLSSTPIDYRPGLGLLWTSAQLGLAAQEIRVTGVTITFRSWTHRTYVLNVGGRLKPSFPRLTGAYQIVPR